MSYKKKQKSGDDQRKQNNDQIQEIIKMKGKKITGNLGGKKICQEQCNVEIKTTTKTKQNPQLNGLERNHEDIL